MISESKIGYVYARDGSPLPPTQTLAASWTAITSRMPRRFSGTAAARPSARHSARRRVRHQPGAVRGHHRRPGVCRTDSREETEKYSDWQEQLEERCTDSILSWSDTAAARSAKAEEPAVGGADLTMTPTDTIGVVTVHDGAPIESGEIIAPEVRAASRDHNYFQDPEIFLALGGRRGKQLQVLTDGTFFINRWFATVEVRPKTLIPIGYVGVVVSYYGSKGEDLTGEGFRYGEQVEPGQRGVWKKALASGQVSGESLCRESRARSDGELRAALDYRPG